MLLTTMLLVAQMIKWDFTVNVGNLVVIGGGVMAFLKVARDVDRRNQKIDMILFGTEQQPGLIKDVTMLKHHMYDNEGMVAKARHLMSHVRMILSGNGIDTGDHQNG